MKKIEAKIVADSISPQGHRITSMLLTYPRFIHGEIMTHRLFSRNSASSRAIPFEKMVKMVEEDPFIPIAWQKNHKGMQGTEYLDIYKTRNAIEKWLQSRDSAIHHAKQLNSDLCNVTKQLCNRLLEPFMWHTTLITATEFENFFELRCSQYVISGINGNKPFRSRKDALKRLSTENSRVKKDHLDKWTDLNWLSSNTSQAEIHIQALAESMWDEMNESTPKQLEEGEWHLPFHDEAFTAFMKSDRNSINQEDLLKVCTSRCARLSYMTHDGEINYEKDIRLHDDLLKNHHMSPFEHCARAMSDVEYGRFIKGSHYGDFDFGMNGEGWCNNFRGWIQYRYLIENGRN